MALNLKSIVNKWGVLGAKSNKNKFICEIRMKIGKDIFSGDRPISNAYENPFVCELAGFNFADIRKFSFHFVRLKSPFCQTED